MDMCECGHEKIKHTAFSGCIGNGTVCQCVRFKEVAGGD